MAAVSLHLILQNLLQRPGVLVLLGCFALVLCLSVPAYFCVLRPRIGTTEWIRRLDARHFSPLQRVPYAMADLIWAPLTALCAACLRFVYLFFHLQLHRKDNAMELLARYIGRFLPRLAACAVAALAVYLLVRSLFGKSSAAVCCGVLLGLTLNTGVYAVTFLSLSLLCLWYWMTTPYDAPLFFGGLWLAAAIVLYAGALLCSFTYLWLAPFYIGVYVAVQILRFRGGDRETRTNKLVLSVLLVVVLLFFGLIAVWLVYRVALRGEGDPVALLRSLSFYRGLFPAIAERMSRLFAPGAVWEHLYVGDAFLFFAGVLSLIPLLHGVIRFRDSRCLLLLLLLPCFFALWLCAGTYAMVLPLALCLGWVWSVYARRGRVLLTVGFACVTALCFLAERIIL